MKISYKILFLSLFLISCSKSISEPRLINVKRFFIAYGIENGIFEGSMNLRPEAYASIIFNFYLYAGRYYSCSKEKGIDKRVLEAELPANKEGALRVLSLKLFRIAEGYGNKEGYNNAFKYLQDKFSKEIKTDYEDCVFVFQPFAITDEEVYAYYSAAIRNKINGISIKQLSKAEQEKARELLHVYCIDPNKTTMDAVKAFKTELEKQSNKKWEGYMNFIKELSVEIYEMAVK